MDNTPLLFSELRKSKGKLNQFLDACNKQHKLNIKALEIFRETYCKRISEAGEFFSRFRTDIEQIPFELAIENWLDKHALVAGIEDACEIFEFLVSQSVIRLEDPAGQILTIGDQAMIGHHRYLEEIRCLDKVSLRKRERIVSIYLQFSSYLAKATLGLVSFQPDPDRIKVEKKSVSYDEFMDFVQYLPERDALMAYLMYFDEPSMTEVIDLKASQVDVNHCLITFGQHQAIYPKYIIKRLQNFMGQKKPEELVFQNRSNEAVNRSRIYRSFKTASLKMTPPQELTPTRLLEKHP